ncbi:MAG: selenocysteine-specific translation elongation factor, partial [Candidatus Adiutrix sp.]
MVKHAIIGTAGHVDHGKTSLIKALTGVDTDRLAEEKKRGITIETGFAHMNLPGGLTAGVADVPGHERFIRNMLSGSFGIDVVMLVVAADEGIMPQTKEHFHILRLLGINTGLVVLTKCDLVEADWLEMVKADVKSFTAGTFLAQAPIVAVSAHLGYGLSNLKEALVSLIQGLKPRPIGEHFRLPLDRVFTMTGFGVVATGTLLDGPIKRDEVVMLYPSGVEAKIRTLQVHSQIVDKGWPGQRVAVNLNVKKDKLARGDTLATSNSLTPTMMLDVRLELLPNTPLLKNNSWVHLYLGTSELLAKIVLMEKSDLRENQSDFAQLRLIEPVVAKRGDRFVIRFYSPMYTIGGGIILDASPLKRRRQKQTIIKQFETKEVGSPLERAELAIKERPNTFAPLSDLAKRAGLNKGQLTDCCHNLVKQKIIVALNHNTYIHRDEMESLQSTLGHMLSVWHQNNPFSLGMSLEEVRSRLLPNASPSTAKALLGIFEKKQYISCELNFVKLSTFTPQINEAENKLISILNDLYLAYGHSPPVLSAVEPAKDKGEERCRQAALASLVRRGDLLRLDEFHYMHTVAFNEAVTVFKDLAKVQETVALGEFRDQLKTSRRLAVAILEHFDKIG